MNFYNQPAFWTFMASAFGGLFGLINFFFSRKNKSNEKKATLEERVENIKSDNIQKSVDYLNGVMARIEPLVSKHEVLMADLDNSTKMVSMIEHEMKKMFGDLSHQYEGFTGKITNITASYQKLLDRVDKLNEDVLNVGKVIYRREK